ncbi:MAG TPA: cupin domain-containing protein [Lachnospiraceae bacterium]|nr:cupin domain-containing protein [Lachnospiraceae bacterium]
MNWNEDNTETQKITAYSSASCFLKDYGPNPLVINIDNATMQNTNYRTTLWTGNYLQLTLMSINPKEDIGLEMHPNLDQFIRIESGKGYVKMGACKDNLDHKATVYENCAIIIPAGMWHNLINTGTVPIKLYSIYAPPQHPFGAIHKTREESDEAEHTH